MVRDVRISPCFLLASVSVSAEVGLFWVMVLLFDAKVLQKAAPCLHNQPHSIRHQGSEAGEFRAQLRGTSGTRSTHFVRNALRQEFHRINVLEPHFNDIHSIQRRRYDRYRSPVVYCALKSANGSIIWPCTNRCVRCENQSGSAVDREK